MLKHLYKISLAFMLVLSIFCFGQEDAAVEASEAGADGEQVQVNPWKPDIMQDGRLIQVGEYTIENPYKHTQETLRTRGGGEKPTRQFLPLSRKCCASVP